MELHAQSTTFVPSIASLLIGMYTLVCVAVTSAWCATSRPPSPRSATARTVQGFKQHHRQPHLTICCLLVVCWQAETFVGTFTYMSPERLCGAC